MDGKGYWADNLFVERLWRSLKYEHVYLHAYESVAEARAKIGRYFAFYNSQRPYSSLGGVNARPGILPPYAKHTGSVTPSLAARGNAGLWKSMKPIFRFPPHRLRRDE